MIEALSTLGPLDAWIVLVGALCGIACAPLGCFLVLRKMSMMGDAISHAVLPGLAVAFLVSGSRASWPMFVGAAVVGILTAVFTEWIRTRGRVDEGASMGVVFTALFALGLVLIVQAADAVDIDPGCVLYGQMEFTPLAPPVAVGPLSLPPVVVTLGVVALVNLAFVGLFFKELKLSSFDPGLADTLGISSTLMHYALMTLVAVTAVASFEAVGNILVVAVLIVPAAAAYLLTDRLWVMVLLSLAVAVLGAALGHVGAIAVPAAFGLGTVSSAGAMAVALGCLLALAVVLAPRHGLVGRALAARSVAHRVDREDMLARLYRRDEGAAAASEPAAALGGESPRRVLKRLLRSGVITLEAGGMPELTEAGRAEAGEVVRRHRLWETYLDRHTGVAPDHLHASAERLEHAESAGLAEALRAEAGDPEVDPQGKRIPRGEAGQEASGGSAGAGASEASGGTD